MPHPRLRHDRSRPATRVRTGLLTAGLSGGWIAALLVALAFASWAVTYARP